MAESCKEGEDEGGGGGRRGGGRGDAASCLADPWHKEGDQVRARFLGGPLPAAVCGELSDREPGSTLSVAVTPHSCGELRDREPGSTLPKAHTPLSHPLTQPLCPLHSNSGPGPKLSNLEEFDSSASPQKGELVGVGSLAVSEADSSLKMDKNIDSTMHNLDSARLYLQSEVNKIVDDGEGKDKAVNIEMRIECLLAKKSNSERLENPQEINHRSCDVRRFDCDTCSKALARLKNFDQTHLGGDGGGGKREKQHQCSLCPRVFARIGHLKNHCSKVHGINIDAGKTVNSQNKKMRIDYKVKFFGGSGPEKNVNVGEDLSRSEVINIHDSEKVNGCDKNIGNDSTKTAIKGQERELENGKNSHPCSDCGKKLDNTAELKQHQKMHEESRKPHVCVNCGKGFYLPDYLEQHRATMHSTDSSNVSAVFICKDCGKAFTSKVKLRRHHRSVHLPALGKDSESGIGKKEFICKICGKGFLTANSLSRHTKNHAAVKPFPCGACERSFLKPSELKRHSLTHTGERPHECNLCGRRFRAINALNVHKIAVLHL